MGLLDRLTNKRELLDELAELRRQVRVLKKEGTGQQGALRSIAGLEEKVIQLNESDRIEYLNSALAKALGIPRENLVGQHLSAVDQFPWGPGMLRELLTEARGNGRPVSRERTWFDPSQGKDVCYRVKVNVENAKPQILIEDLTDLRDLEQTFQRFVAPAVIAKMKELKRDYFKAERKAMTVLFGDLRGFTSTSEKMQPEAVRDIINEYLGLMIDLIEKHEATLDKVVGDEVMAIFGAPIPNDNHALDSLRVAIEMQRGHKKLTEKWAAEGRPAPQLGIGINTGEMMVGTIGTDRRMQYTVLGHHVNLAHRLCEAAEPGQILISQHTFDAILGRSQDIKKEMKFEVVGRIKAKGISQPVEVIQVIP